MKTTVGKILFNDALPRDLQDYALEVSGRNIEEILTKLADRYPDRFPSSVHKIKRLGNDTSFFTAHSVKLADFAPPPKKKAIVEETQRKLAALNRPGKTSLQLKNQMIGVLVDQKAKLEKEVISHGVKTKSGLTEMILSRSRGKPAQLNSMVGAPVLYEDAQNKPIMVPVFNSFGTGLEPVEYWASSYGTRKGVLAEKLATAEGGDFGKRITAPVLNMVISKTDCGTFNGVPEEADRDVLDRYLARDVGGYKRNSLITKEMLSELQRKNIRKIVVRSPLTCASKQGVCGKCYGLDVRGSRPPIGQNVGAIAAQTIAEPVSQGALSTKHGGGAVGKAKTADFGTITSIVDIPKKFVNKAVLAEESGTVRVVKSPIAGYDVYVGDEKHSIKPGVELLVKTGQKVEKGDKLSEGIVNPADVVRLKGLGAGRKHLSKDMQRMVQEAYGADIHKRHYDVFARGILNTVQIDDPEDSDEVLPNDIVDHQFAANAFKPRNVAKVAVNNNAIGKWLAKPYIHYAIGDPITRETIADLKEFGLTQIEVTGHKPNFTPIMKRVLDLPSVNRDWIARLSSKGLKKHLLDAVTRGDISDMHGLHYIPALAMAEEFGQTGPHGEY